MPCERKCRCLSCYPFQRKSVKIENFVNENRERYKLPMTHLSPGSNDESLKEGYVALKAKKWSSWKIRYIKLLSGCLQLKNNEFTSNIVEQSDLTNCDIHLVDEKQFCLVWENDKIFIKLKTTDECFEWISFVIRAKKLDNEEKVIKSIKKYSTEGSKLADLLKKSKKNCEEVRNISQDLESIHPQCEADNFFFQNIQNDACCKHSTTLSTDQISQMADVKAIGKNVESLLLKGHRFVLIIEEQIKNSVTIWKMLESLGMISKEDKHKKDDCGKKEELCEKKLKNVLTTFESRADGQDQEVTFQDARTDLENNEKQISIDRKSLFCSFHTKNPMKNDINNTKKLETNFQDALNSFKCCLLSMKSPQEIDEQNRIKRNSQKPMISIISLDIGGLSLNPFFVTFDFDSITAKELTKVFWDTHFRLEWDVSVESLAVIQNISPNEIVVYQTHKQYWPIAPRDVCFRSTRSNHPDDYSLTEAIIFQEDNLHDYRSIGEAWSVVNLSEENEDAPIIPNYVRAKVCAQLLGQTMIKLSKVPTSHNFNDVSISRCDVKCRMKYMCHVNPGGYIPQKALSLFAERDLTKFVTKIHSVVKSANISDPPNF